MAREDRKILMLLLLFLTACVKDKPPMRGNTIPANVKGVYVACEGQYPLPNASLYIYHPDTDSVFGDVYQAVNNQPLGEVFQDMQKIDGHFFLSVNNSDKVVVLDPVSLLQVVSIHIRQPRYILAVGSGKAYVSTLYSNKVYVISTSAFTVIDSIVLPTLNGEHMALAGGYAFISSWDTATRNIYKVNIAANTITQAIQVGGCAPHDVLVDRLGMLWVVAGNQAYNKVSTLTRVDPSTGDVLAAYTFATADDPIKATFNPSADTLYYINANYNGGKNNNGIYRMAITQSSLPADPFIASPQSRYFWAMGIDPSSGLIYLGDPKGFTQKGTVYVYNTSGVVRSSFSVGVGPGQFYFDE